jgi:ribulose-bisphosphate carboxylase small chain
MKLTQGCFSFLPDLTDDQITKQVQYCLANGWAVNIEFTDDPHPRNTYWEMWGLPMFDLQDAAGVMMELAECRRVYGDRYIRISGFDSSPGWESVRISFLVNRPPQEAEFELVRQEVGGRAIRYTTVRRPPKAARPISISARKPKRPGLRIRCSSSSRSWSASGRSRTVCARSLRFC